MITFSKVSSSIKENGKRILKVLQFGTKTAKQASSFGDDSSPLKEMTAIFAETSNNAEPVIIGYINTQQLAKKGEKRIFSMQENGSLSADIWLKNDRTIEIHGNEKNMVRYQELEIAFNQLRTDFNNHVALYNTHVALYNAHIHITPAGIPSAITPPLPPWFPSIPSVADITPAKIDNIKTN